MPGMLHATVRLVIGFGGDLATKRGDLRIFVQPSEQCERVGQFSEPDGARLRVVH